MGNFTITQLNYMVALARYQNFVQAASVCHVTQPTLSIQIEKLEVSLGVTLFDRTKRPVILTDVGRSILEQAKIILRETERIEEIIQEEEKTLMGEFVLGVIPSVAESLLPRFMPDFIKKYPDVELTIRELQTSDMVVALENENIHAGIAATPLENPKIKERPLYYEKFEVYLSRNDELSGFSEIHMNQLYGRDVLLMGEGHCVGNQVGQICKVREKRSDRLAIESGNFGTLMKLVETGMGITLLPELYCDDLSTKQKKLLRPIAGKSPVREISLLTKRGQIKKRLMDALVTEVLYGVPPKLLELDRKITKIISP